MTPFWILLAAVLALILAKIAVGWRSVHVMARMGNVTRLRALLDRNPGLVRATLRDGETAVHQASKFGELRTLQLLLERGADPNATTKEGVTPLHMAAVYGELNAVRYLLDHGAHVDPKEGRGVTPLLAAMSAGQDEVKRILLEAGADPNVPPPLLEVSDGHFVVAIADGDPLMALANAKAQESLPTLRELFARSPRDTAVKFPFQSDSGALELVWGDLLELSVNTFKVRMRAPPAWHDGPFEWVQTRPVTDVRDWHFEQRDKRIRGGFGLQVVVHRTRERAGRLPPELAAMEGRFVDDIRPLFAETVEATDGPRVRPTDGAPSASV